MVETEQESDLGLMMCSLTETCEEAWDRRRKTFAVELAPRGETRVPMNL